MKRKSFHTGNLCAVPFDVGNLYVVPWELTGAPKKKTFLKIPQ